MLEQAPLASSDRRSPARDDPVLEYQAASRPSRHRKHGRRAPPEVEDKPLVVGREVVAEVLELTGRRNKVDDHSIAALAQTNARSVDPNRTNKPPRSSQPYCSASVGKRCGVEGEDAARTNGSALEGEGCADEVRIRMCV